MKRVRFVIIFTALVCGLVFILCSLYLKADTLEPTEYTQTESQAPRFELHGTNIDGLQMITDNQTGVQYLKYRTSGLTPLLNLDGSLMLDGEAGGPLP